MENFFPFFHFFLSFLLFFLPPHTDNFFLRLSFIENIFLFYSLLSVGNFKMLYLVCMCVYMFFLCSWFPCRNSLQKIFYYHCGISSAISDLNFKYSNFFLTPSDNVFFLSLLRSLCDILLSFEIS